MKRKVTSKVSKAQLLLKTAKLARKSSKYCDIKLYCFNCKNLKKKNARFNFSTCTKCEALVLKLLAKPYVLCSQNKSCHADKDGRIVCERCLLKLCYSLGAESEGERPLEIGREKVVLERLNKSSSSSSPENQDSTAMSYENCETSLVTHCEFDPKSFACIIKNDNEPISKEQLQNFVFLNPKKFFDAFIPKEKNKIQRESKSMTVFKEQPDQAETLSLFLKKSGLGIKNTNKLCPTEKTRKNKHKRTLKSKMLSRVSKNPNETDYLNSNNELNTGDKHPSKSKVIYNLLEAAPVEVFKSRSPDLSENTIFFAPYDCNEAGHNNSIQVDNRLLNPILSSNYEDIEKNSNEVLNQNIVETVSAKNNEGLDFFYAIDADERDMRSVLSPSNDPSIPDVECIISEDYLSNSILASHSVVEPITPEAFNNNNNNYTSCTSVRVVSSKNEIELTDTQCPLQPVDNDCGHRKDGSELTLCSEESTDQISPNFSNCLTPFLNSEFMPTDQSSLEIMPTVYPSSNKNKLTVFVDSCASSEKCMKIENTVDLCSGSPLPECFVKIDVQSKRFLPCLVKSENAMITENKNDMNTSIKDELLSTKKKIKEKKSSKKNFVINNQNLSNRKCKKPKLAINSNPESQKKELPLVILSPVRYKIPKLSLKNTQNEQKDVEALNLITNLAENIDEEKCKVEVEPKKKKLKQSEKLRDQPSQKECLNNVLENNSLEPNTLFSRLKPRKSSNIGGIQNSLPFKTEPHIKFDTNFSITCSTNTNDLGSSRTVKQTESTLLKNHSSDSYENEELDYEPDTLEESKEGSADETIDPILFNEQFNSYGIPKTMVADERTTYVNFSPFKDIDDPDVEIVSCKINQETRSKYVTKTLNKLIKKEPIDIKDEGEILLEADDIVDADLVVHPGEELDEFLATKEEAELQRTQATKEIIKPTLTLPAVGKLKINNNQETLPLDIIPNKVSNLETGRKYSTPSTPVALATEILPSDICQNFLTTGFCSVKLCPQVHSKTSTKINEPTTFNESLQRDLKEGHFNKAISRFTDSARTISKSELIECAVFLIENIFRLSQFSHLRNIINIITNRNDSLNYQTFLNAITMLCEPLVEMQVIRDSLLSIFYASDSSNQIKLNSKFMIVLMKSVCSQPVINLKILLKILHFYIGKLKFDPPVEYVCIALKHIKEHQNLARPLQHLLRMFSVGDLAKLEISLCESLLEILQQYNHPEANALEAQLNELHIYLDGRKKESEQGLKWKLIDWATHCKWKELVKYFIDRGLHQNDGVVMHNVFCALVHEKLKMVFNFRNFINHITDQESRIDHRYMSSLCQIGTAIMLEKYIEKDFELAYQTLELLHRFNINYYFLQSALLSYTRGHNFVLGSWAFQTPNGLALSAVEICLEVAEPMSAVTVLNSCNWARIRNSRGETVNQEWNRKANLLSRLARCFLEENMVKVGVTVLTEYLDMFETDQQKEDVTLMSDTCDLYNLYMVALVNARDLSTGLNLLEYYHQMEVTVDLKESILRALIVLCVNSQSEEKAEELFVIACRIGIYKKQQVNPLSKPHRLLIMTHLTQQEMKLVLLDYIKQLKISIFQKSTATFESSLHTAIY